MTGPVYSRVILENVAARISPSPVRMAEMVKDQKKLHSRGQDRLWVIWRSTLHTHTHRHGNQYFEIIQIIVLLYQTENILKNDENIYK